MQLESTDKQPLKWRVWHSANYCTGAVFFFFGSMLLYPYFSTIFDSGFYSAWLYTIGSLTFSFADATQWSYYEPIVICKSQSCCLIPNLSLNFFMSMTGSILYLVGSAMFIPSINKAETGLLLFIIASTIIMISQTWKVGRVIFEGKENGNISAAIREDLNGVLVDVFAGFGSAMYFSGSFVFFDPSSIMQNLGSTIFTCGGLFFSISAFFMIRRYFFKKLIDGKETLATSVSKVYDPLILKDSMVSN